MSGSRPRVVVIGAGITGAFAAYFLAKDGADVLILDPAEPGNQASGNNPGGLNPLHGAGIPGPLLPLALRSFRLQWELQSEWEDCRAGGFPMHRVERFEVAMAESEVSGLRERVGLYCEHGRDGFRAEWLDAEALFRVEPLCTREARGALRVWGNGMVDGRRHTAAVVEAAKRRGARFEQRGATGVETTGERVAAVCTAAGRILCDAVVVAMGSWSREAESWFGVSIPVIPVKGQLLRVRGLGGRMVGHLSHGLTGIYRLPSDEAWLGGTYEKVGCDLSLTVEGRRRVLANAERLMPGLAGCEVLEHVAALRPGTPDDLPVVGRVGGWENVWVASGGGMKGMLVGAGMGEGVGRMVLGREWDLANPAYEVNRFAVRAQEKRVADRETQAVHRRRAEFSVVCEACGKTFERVYSPFCDRCGGMTEVVYNLERVRLWDDPNPYRRYRELLPVWDADLFPERAERTPTIHAKRLGEALGMEKLYLKDETCLPTGTTKDRMAAVALPYLWESGVRTFCTSSTGNSSTAYAVAAGRFPGLKVHVFTASAFRDRVHYRGNPHVIHHVMEGASFAEAFEYSGVYARKRGYVSERGFFNLGRREGLKVAWLEAVEQVGEGIDWYVQAVSSAMGVYGTYKGAKEMCGLGLAKRPPRLLCVQQESCAPMVRAWEEGCEAIQPRHIVRQPSGIAQAILRGDPTKAYPHVRRIVRESGGRMLAVSETEIREARELLQRLEGVSACFSASAAVAGLAKAVRLGEFPREQSVLVNLTGSDRPSDPELDRHQEVRWWRKVGDEWMEAEGNGGAEGRVELEGRL